MSLFHRRLMKWREPKVRGMVTPANVLVAAALALLVSVLFGFGCGHGRFNVTAWLAALAFMAAAPLGLAILPFSPGNLVQLRETMIVYGCRGTDSCRSDYKDITTIYYMRNCSYGMVPEMLASKDRVAASRPCLVTYFQVLNRHEDYRSVTQFTVPEHVDVEQVLKILRDKGVRVIEVSPPDETSGAAKRFCNGKNQSSTNHFTGPA